LEHLKTLFDFSKLPTKFFILFAVASGFILFARPEWLSIIEIANIKKEYGQYIGLTFIISTGLVAINFLIWIQKYLSNKIKVFSFKKEYAQNVKTLDPQEKAVIREFFIRGQSSIEMPIDDPVVNGLISKNILKINKQFGNSFIMSGMNASVSLMKRADKLLKLSDIDLNENPSEDEIELIKTNRPSWTDKWNRRY